jgi:hypothetical protein
MILLERLGGTLEASASPSPFPSLSPWSLKLPSFFSQDFKHVYWGSHLGHFTDRNELRKIVGLAGRGGLGHV